MHLIPAIEDKLMSLPPSPVWIHEKAMHKACRVPSGQAFGQRAVLNCVLRGIDKGFCGAKKNGKRVDMLNHIPGFSNENSGSNISFDTYGRAEEFSNGTLCDATKAKPKWFRGSSEPLTDVSTQIKLVAELMGDVNSLPDDVLERRHQNYQAFLKGGTQTLHF